MVETEDAGGHMIRNRRAAAQDSETVAAVAAELRHTTFFEGFSDDELGRVAELAEEVVAEEGALVIDQGRVGQECFVILRGQAGVYVGGEHIATLGPGSMVGEMALVEHRPRNASVVAETMLRMIVFDTRAFKQLLEEMPKAHDRVIALLLARMRTPEGR
jgi:CRP/FNR family transcriptional regulator, cyclic AMP receptor protein